MGQTFYQGVKNAKPTEFKLEGITIATNNEGLHMQKNESGELEQWNTTSY